MTERIHDDEPDTSEPVVRALLEVECPQWSGAPLSYLKTSGTDNAMWRLKLNDEADLVVRLPRRPGAAAGVSQETAVLQQLEHAPMQAIARTPVVRHAGQPHEAFPHHWTVLEWIDGNDAWSARRDLGDGDMEALALDLGAAVTAIAATAEAEVQPREPASRGGPLGPLLEQLDQWLEDPGWNASALVDVAAVKRLAAEAHEVIDEPVSLGFVHGDLIPGNLLVDSGRLTAIIDWGGAGHGDLSQDLAPAWAVLDSVHRPAFREATGADDAAWIRGRAFELEHAVGGILYYVPRRHSLGDVMTRTLGRILSDT